MVVVEAAARGTPSVVVAGEDNAATELIEEGVNGIVARARRRAEDSPRRSCACTRRAPRCASARRDWFAAQRRAAVAGGARCDGARADAATSAPAAPARARSSRASARAVRSQVKLRAPARGPRRAAARAARRRRRAARSSASRDRADVARVEQQRRVAGDLGQRGARSSRRPARRAPSPRAPAARSPRTATGTRTRAASAHSPSSSRRDDPAGQAHVARRRPSARGALAQLAPRARSGSPGARAPAAAPAAIAASASISARRFLCGRLAESAQHDRPVAERRAARAASASRRRRTAATAPRPSGTTSIRSAGRRASSSSRSSRVLCESAITRCERRAASRHEHAHAQVAHARSARRESARRSGRGRSTTRAKRPAQRRGAGRGCARRSTPARAASARQQRLLAEHPLHAAARAYTGTVTAGSSSPHGPPAAAASRLTNAVKRRSAGARVAQRRDQLARGDLHPAGLAGDEEDEVQADVHAP